MRVEWDAVAADSRPRIESHEPERLCGGGPNDFPSVDAERVTKPRHFIRHSDVDSAERVLPELARLGDPCGRNGMHFTDDLAVKHRSDLRGIFCNAAHNLWNVVRLELRIARIDALG